MLKLSGIQKTKKFDFTDTDGELYELEVSEYTVADIKKMIGLQDVIEKDKLNTIDSSDVIVISRIICSVKVRETGDYFWDKPTDLDDKYPNTLITALYKEVGLINPIKSGESETLDEKKN